MGDTHGVSRLDVSLIYQLGRTHEVLIRDMADELSRHGIQPHRMAVLILIMERPGITPGEICAVTMKDKSTLTPVLADLVRQGIIAKKPSERDARSFGLHLTDKGEADVHVMDEIRTAREARLSRLLAAAGLSPEMLLDALKSMRDVT